MLFFSRLKDNWRSIETKFLKKLFMMKVEKWACLFFSNCIKMYDRLLYVETKQMPKCLLVVLAKDIIMLHSYFPL